MSCIYYHNSDISRYDKMVVNEIVDNLETYLCDYKLAFNCVWINKNGHKVLVRLDISRLGSKSIIASYSFHFKTLSKFKRKIYMGSISYDDVIEVIDYRYQHEL